MTAMVAVHITEEEWEWICERRATVPAAMITTAEEIARRLRQRADRDVYESCQPGHYFITYRGGEVAAMAITDALKKGLIVQKYPGVDGCWSLA